MENRKRWLIFIKNVVLIVLAPLFVAIILRVFFIEMYKIPSSSMEPALIPGDFILVSKMSYGARLLNRKKFFKQNKIEYIRTKGWTPIEKGDVFVFNFTIFEIFSDSSVTTFRNFLIKRCYGLPGDSVIIKSERMEDGGITNYGITGIQTRGRLFPHDTLLDWSLDNYGPLYIPAKGQKMNLTSKNIQWYYNYLRYENPYCQVKDSILIINGKPVLQYTFKHNYYFMLGDNFYHSDDSRYWGFIPKEAIIGKAVLVLFSLDPYEFGFKKIRWNRLLKKIK